MTEDYEHSGNAQRTTLATGIDASILTIVAADLTDYPLGAGAARFVITLERNVVGKEEKVLCESRAANTITVAAGGRGYDGTTAVAHSSGATIEHTVSAIEIEEGNDHIVDTTRDDHTQYLNTTRHATQVHTSAQPVTVKRNTVTIGTRPKINFIESYGLRLTAADDAGSGEVDVTFEAVVPEGRALSSGTTHFSIPGVESSSVGTLAITAGRLYHMPIYVSHDIAIDRLAFEVTTLDAGDNARVGIYAADEDWQPVGSPLADSGDISVATTGVKTATVAVTLTQGRYLFVLVCSGAPTLRILSGGGRYSGLASTLGATPFLGQMYRAFAYAAFPAAADWDTITGSATGTQYMVMCRISDPTP